ncbi:MAG TPA: GNAT family protein [Xanthomonadaceae bacterium]|nr:GNAT family N-acetyltransferase [Xanthomonadales bacterium]HPF74619.1 GNAT family protein [Xanthomonadaceae bacterium]
MIESTCGRLVLIPSTTLHLRTELEAPHRLGELLEASVSPDWPCGEYDQDAMRYFLECLESGGTAAEGWYGWYALTPHEPIRALVGAGGYFGPPDENGGVEIGYSILPEWRRHGLATLLSETLVARAFDIPTVRCVRARTTPENTASIRVLERSGFQQCGSLDGDGRIHFERMRQ